MNNENKEITFIVQSRGPVQARREYPFVYDEKTRPARQSELCVISVTRQDIMVRDVASGKSPRATDAIRKFSVQVNAR